MKIFAPFETELGTWSNVQGAYVLRATAPPVTIKPGRRDGIALGYLWLMWMGIDARNLLENLGEQFEV